MEASTGIPSFITIWHSTKIITADPIPRSDVLEKIIRATILHGCTDPVTFGSFVSTFRAESSRFILDLLYKHKESASKCNQSLTISTSYRKSGEIRNWNQSDIAEDLINWWELVFDVMNPWLVEVFVSGNREVMKRIKSIHGYWSGAWSSINQQGMSIDNDKEEARRECIRLVMNKEIRARNNPWVLVRVRTRGKE